MVAVTEFLNTFHKATFGFENTVCLMHSGWRNLAMASKPSRRGKRDTSTRRGRQWKWTGHRPENGRSKLFERARSAGQTHRVGSERPRPGGKMVVKTAPFLPHSI